MLFIETEEKGMSFKVLQINPDGLQIKSRFTIVKPPDLDTLTILSTWIQLTLTYGWTLLISPMDKSVSWLRYTAEALVSITLGSMYQVVQFTTNVFHKIIRKSFHKTLSSSLVIGLLCQSVMVLECSGAQAGLDEQLTAYVSGDITLGGLFPVHDKSTDPSIPCKPVINSERGIQVGDIVDYSTYTI